MLAFDLRNCYDYRRKGETKPFSLKAKLDN